MPSHNFRAAMLTAAPATCLATTAGAQGFISPGALAVSPPGQSSNPAPAQAAPQAAPEATPSAARPRHNLRLPTPGPPRGACRCGCGRCPKSGPPGIQVGAAHPCLAVGRSVNPPPRRGEPRLGPQPGTCGLAGPASGGNCATQISRQLHARSPSLGGGFVSGAGRTTEALAGLLVETPKGCVPLRTFADVENTNGPNQVLRENGRRRIVVQANTDGSDMGAIIRAIQSKARNLALPAGYSVGPLGSFWAQGEAAKLIGVLSLVSLAMVSTVLYSRYRSAVLVRLIMSNIQLAPIGSVAAVWLAGQPLSVATMVGFITLTDISARNGILKVSHYINHAWHEGFAFWSDMVVCGSLKRLTSLLMTALSAGFALQPLIIGAGAPGKEILHPVAITIFGGLVSTTLLDTLLTPVLFLRIGRRPFARREGNSPCHQKLPGDRLGTRRHQLHDREAAHRGHGEDHHCAVAHRVRKDSAGPLRVRAVAASDFTETRSSP